MLRNLRTNAVMAMRSGDRAAANKAIELVGRFLGMFFDRKSIEITVTRTRRGICASWRRGSASPSTRSPSYSKTGAADGLGGDAPGPPLAAITVDDATTAALASGGARGGAEGG